MGEYYQNRRRRDINQKRIINQRLFIITIIITIIFTIVLTIFIDQKMNHILKNYIDVEVDRIATTIMNNAIKKVIKQYPNELLIISRNQKNEIEQITYNTVLINKMKEDIENTLEKEYQNVESGYFKNSQLVVQDKAKRIFQDWKNGFICEVNFNSLRGSTLFGNVGPNIPIKLSFMGYSYVDINLDIQEYGINNVIVRMDVVLQTSTLVTMPISSKVHETSIKYPISMEIIKGEIPNYLTAVEKREKDYHFE